MKKKVLVLTISAVALSLLVIALSVDLPLSNTKVDSYVPSKTKRLIGSNPRTLEHDLDRDTIEGMPVPIRVVFKQVDRTELAALGFSWLLAQPGALPAQTDHEQNQQFFERLEQEVELENFWHDIRQQPKQQQYPTLWEMLQEHKALDRFWGDDSPEPSP